MSERPVENARDSIGLVSNSERNNKVKVPPVVSFLGLLDFVLVDAPDDF